MTDPIELYAKKPGSVPSVERQHITPSEAAELLCRNATNRTLSRSHVDRIARDISADRWVFDGSPIRILNDGTLGDGQHRLAACVQAGKPIDVMVVSGLDATSIETVDSGRKRTLSDRLRMRGIARSTSLAVVLNGLWGLAHSDMSATPTPSEALRMLERYNDLPEFVSVHALPSGMRFLARPAMVFGFVGHKTGNNDAAEKWLQAFKNGVPSRVDGCPAHALRETLIRAQQNRQSIGGQAIARTMRLSCRAWIAMRTGAPLKVVRQHEKIGLPEWSPADVS